MGNKVTLGIVRPKTVYTLRFETEGGQSGHNIELTEDEARQIYAQLHAEFGHNPYNIDPFRPIGGGSVVISKRDEFGRIFVSDKLWRDIYKRGTN